ncbi:MAG TPA: hypothetical protein VGF55_26945 [Gemmataceae bacterium]|jgi:hypothetical protein
MGRRRLVVVVGVLALVAAGAWWLSVDRLTTDEQRLLGVWHSRLPLPPVMTLTLTADHRCEVSSYPNVASGRWWVRDATVFLDMEPSPARRSVRPLLDRVGVMVVPVLSLRAADFDLDGTNGHRAHWTRAPAD